MASMSLRQNASTYSVSSCCCRSSRSGVDGVLGEALLAELGVGALEGRVDRGHGGVEGLGGLLGRPAQHVAQDEHGALAGGQVLQRGHEGEPDRVLLGHHDGGVGHRLEPGDLGVELEGVAGQLVGRAEPGGQRSPGAGLEVGEADVRRDPVEPRAHRAAALEVGAGLPRAQQGLLDEVLRLVHRPAHPVAVRQQLTLVARGQRREVLQLAHTARRRHLVIPSLRLHPAQNYRLGSTPGLIAG